MLSLADLIHDWRSERRASPPISWSDLPLRGLEGDPIPATDLDGRVVLVVNVASRCGFTPQYAGLQALHERLSERGLVVLGVACNQFAWQEPGTADQIRDFCSLTYGVSFPILEKQAVNGANRSGLYKALVYSDIGQGKGVRWNFEKFVVGRDGAVVARFGSATTPDDPKLLDALDVALALPRTAA